MNNIAVIYQSHYGTTQKYAEWIAQALDADLLNRKKVSVSDLSQYDMIIYGGGLYAGGLLGIDLVSKSKFKHLVVFTVGLADPKLMDYAEIMAKAFQNQAYQPDQVYHFRGGIDYPKLSFLHRSLMTLLKKTVEKKSDSEISAEGKAILETYGQKVDFIDKEVLIPLLTYVKEILA
ncbi:flavodoxin domain-containing protein [Pseudolactococcus reticulitermitis]|uniref:Flavodoxin-like domain-containing protein n=1 Tax=Pseudolactococcus reticulitermitis TaxID=2025039 RepID=A0A224X9P8_9LACT|nr:flavodoxin domain-containing protein [Lactococcus reticulitermitis]GAX46423.1 hypothetical protein RsY01_02 [Lactococcus reticulitermitis]